MVAQRAPEGWLGRTWLTPHIGNGNPPPICHIIFRLQSLFCYVTPLLLHILNMCKKIKKTSVLFGVYGGLYDGPILICESIRHVRQPTKASVPFGSDIYKLHALVIKHLNSTPKQPDFRTTTKNQTTAIDPILRDMERNIVNIAFKNSRLHSGRFRLHSKG